MNIPLQITFRHMEPSAALEARIRKLAARFEHFSGHIVGCRVSIEAPSHHPHQGALYDVHIDITVPGEEISIRHAHSGDHAHEDAYVTLRDAFRAVRRRLEDYERRRRHQVKAHAVT
jgi:ribosome-associated translation inhibitor RaiA